MGKKLTNAPVYYTVAQVQFNPILDLDAYVAPIQAKMRELHFPDFKQEVVQQLVFPSFNSGEQGPSSAPTLAQKPRYLFGDIRNGSLFILDTNTLSFQTTAYDTFEDFSATLLKGLSILHGAVRLDFVERIGVRYLDAVRPSKEGETLKDFLVPQVLGFALRDDGAQLQHAISETIVKMQTGQLLSRVLIRAGKIGLPMDLAAGSPPKINERFMLQDGLHAIVDTDASIQQREIFDLARVDDRLRALHDEITKSFEATVTKHAFASWA